MDKRQERRFHNGLVALRDGSRIFFPAEQALLVHHHLGVYERSAKADTFSKFSSHGLMRISFSVHCYFPGGSSLAVVPSISPKLRDAL